jgi:hypothetical protein
MELIVTIAPSSLDSITAAVREQITQPDLPTTAAISNGSVAERLANDDEFVTLVAEGVASEISASDVAREMDTSDVADHLCMSSLAEYVADNVDTDDVANAMSIREVAKCLDISRVAEELDFDRIIEHINHKQLALQIVTQFVNNSEFRETVMDAIFERITTKVS